MESSLNRNGGPNDLFSLKGDACPKRWEGNNNSWNYTLNHQSDSVAPVPEMALYDTIYQERYMGLPQENAEDYIQGSPITFAKNLKGNLLIIHGAGAGNVHYQRMERLINELIKNNKQFTMFDYPSRDHGIFECENTNRHL